MFQLKSRRRSRRTTLDVSRLEDRDLLSAAPIAGPAEFFSFRFAHDRFHGPVHVIGNLYEDRFNNTFSGRNIRFQQNVFQGGQGSVSLGGTDFGRADQNPGNPPGPPPGPGHGPGPRPPGPPGPGPGRPGPGGPGPGPRMGLPPGHPPGPGHGPGPRPGGPGQGPQGPGAGQISGPSDRYSYRFSHDRFYGPVYIIGNLYEDRFNNTFSGRRIRVQQNLFQGGQGSVNLGGTFF